jgi:L-ribulose-5-phosphate 4-epimerase
MISYAAVKEKSWACNQELPRSGLVVHTFGNASAFDASAGVFAIKPSGVPFDVLKPEMMVVVDLEGKVVDGILRPSSDTPTHAVLYRAWPDLGGIVHTHSPHALAWAQARRAIPVLGTTHADCMPRDIPCTLPLSARKIQGAYEEATGRQIVSTVGRRSHHEIQMVLVASHGPFAWGATAEEAVENSILLELIARTALLTLQINPRTPRLAPALLKKHFTRKHGPQATYGQARD